MARTFAQRIKEDRITNAAVRHVQALRSENLLHPEVKASYDAIPAAYKRERKWDSKKADYVGPNQNIYIDASQYGSKVHISINLYDLKGIKNDRRLTTLLEKIWAGDDWVAQPTTDCTYSEKFRGRVFSFIREVPPRLLADNHPSVKWLRKHGHTGDLNDFLKKPLVIKVSVHAYVKEENETCRIEVTEVREEVVRTEVKRLVCA